MVQYSASFITQATNLYGRNDLDMVGGMESILPLILTSSTWQLEIGNGNLTYDEAKTHFTTWALLKAPLLIGTNVSSPVFLDTHTPTLSFTISSPLSAKRCSVS
jgi:hypothetical protein